jgi:hypothetical protein
MPGYPALIWGGGDGISNANVPNYIDLGHLNIGTGESLSINNGQITVNKSFIHATAGSSGTTNQIWTINGGGAGSIIVLRCGTTTTIKDGTGNIQLSGDFTMNHSSDTLVLIRITPTGNWLQLARANNG